MRFKFKYPECGCARGEKNTCLTNPRCQFAFGNMTISVLHPINDIKMIHGQKNLEHSWWLKSVVLGWILLQAADIVQAISCRLLYYEVGLKYNGQKRCKNIKQRHVHLNASKLKIKLWQLTKDIFLVPDF
jgi:hypothetical protein